MPLRWCVIFRFSAQRFVNVVTIPKCFAKLFDSRVLLMQVKEQFLHVCLKRSFLSVFFFCAFIYLTTWSTRCFLFTQHSPDKTRWISSLPHFLSFSFVTIKPRFYPFFLGGITCFYHNKDRLKPIRVFLFSFSCAILICYSSLPLFFAMDCNSLADLHNIIGQHCSATCLLLNTFIRHFSEKTERLKPFCVCAFFLCQPNGSSFFFSCSLLYGIYALHTTLDGQNRK